MARAITVEIMHDENRERRQAGMSPYICDVSFDDKHVASYRVRSTLLSGRLVSYQGCEQHLPMMVEMAGEDWRRYESKNAS